MPFLCSYGKEYKGETGRPLKVRLEHRKTAVMSETMKSNIADHVWKEKDSYKPPWNEMKILNKEEH